MTDEQAPIEVPADVLPPPLRLYANQINQIERDYRAGVLELQKERQRQIDEALRACEIAMHDPRKDPAT